MHYLSLLLLLVLNIAFAESTTFKNMSSPTNNDSAISEADFSAMGRKAPVMDYKKIEPYTTSVQILDPEALEAISHVDSIMGANPDEASAGDRVRVDHLPAETNGKQSSYFVILEKKEPYLDPNTGKVLGYRVKQKGDGVLQSMPIASQKAILWIKNNTDPIKVGDLIVPAPTLPSLSFVPDYSGVALESQIVALFNRPIDDKGIQKDDIVVIIGGIARGLKAGDRLEVYRTPKALSAKMKSEYTSVPDVATEVAIGEILVFRTFQHVSFAIVMAARQPLHLLDKVVNF